MVRSDFAPRIKPKGKMTMTEQAQANSSEAPANAATEGKSPVDKLRAQFAKSDRVVCWSGSEQTDFAAFLETFGDDDPITDWTDGVNYENPTLALVGAENSDNRFISLPNIDVALSDAIVRGKAYEWYIGKATRAAMKESAAKQQFATPGGFFVGFDLDAFRFQAGDWVDFFHAKGLKSIQIRTLKAALASQPYAASQFPKVPKSLWERVLGAMAEKAEKAGKDASIFAHWIGTRDAAANLDMPELDFSDDELAHVGEASPDDNVKSEGAEPAKAADPYLAGIAAPATA